MAFFGLGVGVTDIPVLQTPATHGGGGGGPGSGDELLLEAGDTLLLENGDALLLEA